MQKLAFTSSITTYKT